VVIGIVTLILEVFIPRCAELCLPVDAGATYPALLPIPLPLSLIFALLSVHNEYDPVAGIETVLSIRDSLRMPCMWGTAGVSTRTRLLVRIGRCGAATGEGWLTTTPGLIGTYGLLKMI
jgi:hypothetical protein